MVLWQPPEAEADASKPQRSEGAPPARCSPFREAGLVVAELVACGLRPLVFVAARKLAEIVASAARDALKARGLASAAAAVGAWGGCGLVTRREFSRD